jgi:histidinol-phosphate aminotransferase
MRLIDFKQKSKDLKEYSPGMISEIHGKGYSISHSKRLKLNANENLFLHKSFIQGILIEAASETDPRIYPEQEEQTLIKKIARLHNLSKDQIILASGGDQLIDLVLSSFMHPIETLLVITPTFSMYPRMAKIKELDFKSYDVDRSFGIDPERVLSSSKDADMIILCNPNNPTSNQFPRDTILEIVDGFDNIVLIDEAYADFGRYSLINEAAERDNLIILRTFSKAYGLAGLRLGYAITNSFLAKTLSKKYLMPYAVPNVVLRAGAKILDRQTMISGIVEKIKQERDDTIKSLNKIEGVTAFQSDTNFVLLNTDKPYEKVYKSLLEKGVIIRKIGEVSGFNNCLRVTVAPRDIMETFLNVLKEAMG